MIELLWTVIPSVFWLVYRCIKLFQVPVDEIISDLNIDIPHIPNICVDSITPTSIIIHWDIQLHYDENLYYVLLVNNKEVSTLTSRSCKLSDLKSDTLYQIQIIAINISTKYRSISNSVYVETLSGANTPLESIKQAYNNDFKTGQATKSGITLETSDLPSEQDIPKNLDVNAIKQITDEAVLQKYLKYYQVQLVKLFKEFKVLEQNVSLEYKKLQQHNTKLMQDSKSQNSTINKNSTTLKENQKRKEDLLLQKSKLNSKLLEVKKSIEHKSKNLDSLKMDAAKLSNKKAYIEKNGDSDKAKLYAQIEKGKQEILDVKYQLSMIEDNLKLVKTKRKHLSKLHNDIHELSVKFNDSCFNKDHSLNEKAFEILNELYHIKPEWAKSIEGEKNNLHDFDQAFKFALLNALKNYTNIYNSLETLKSSTEKNYSPSWISEASAANRFGCQHYHPGKVFKNRNRSNSKGFKNVGGGNVGNGNGSSSSSNSASPGPGHVSAPGSTVMMTGINTTPIPMVNDNSNTSYGSIQNANVTAESMNPGFTGIAPETNGFNNYYGDIYTQDDDILSPPSYDSVFKVNYPQSDSPSLGGMQPYYNPMMDSSPNVSAVNLSVPNVSNWNNNMSGINSPSLQAQHLHHSQSQPSMQHPVQGQQPDGSQNQMPEEHSNVLPRTRTDLVAQDENLVDLLNHPNLSTSSLGSNKFSRKIWNPSSLNHGRSISGSNIWDKNGFGVNNAVDRNDFRPFESSQLFNTNNMKSMHPMAGVNNMNMSVNGINGLGGINLNNMANLNGVNTLNSGSHLNTPQPSLFGDFPRSPTTSSPPNMSFLNPPLPNLMNQSISLNTQSPSYPMNPSLQQQQSNSPQESARLTNGVPGQGADELLSTPQSQAYSNEIDLDT